MRLTQGMLPVSWFYMYLLVREYNYSPKVTWLYPNSFDYATELFVPGTNLY